MSEKTEWPAELKMRIEKPRRSDAERRSGKDKRFWFTKRKEGERRSGDERRVLPDRRKNPR